MYLASVTVTGTKPGRHDIDPSEIAKNRTPGAIRAASNRASVANLIDGGQLDDRIQQLIARGIPGDLIAWVLADHLAISAHQSFLQAWERPEGNAGDANFELNPLDKAARLSPADAVKRDLAVFAVDRASRSFSSHTVAPNATNFERAGDLFAAALLNAVHAAGVNAQVEQGQIASLHAATSNRTTAASAG
jgi:hypothetical protein